MSESITKVGVVTQISEEVKTKKDKSGTFKVYNLFVDEKKYGLGYKRKLVDDANVTTGDTVKVTIVKTGDYWNVDSLEKVDPQATVATPDTKGDPEKDRPAVEPTGATTPARTNGANGVQQQIVRQTALKVSADMVIGFANAPTRKAAMPLDQQLGKIVAFADHFVKYVETGKVDLANVEDAKKLTEEGVVEG